MSYPRIVIAALGLSMAGYVGIATHEGWMGTAAVPTKNDRCTNGFGSTFREDGTPVPCGETIDPVRAVKRSAAHIAKDESGLKRCLEGVELNQVEYDVFVDFSYQYGVEAACKSSTAKAYKHGDYAAACEGYNDYRFLTSSRPIEGWEPYKWDASGKPIRWRFDCSTPGNRVCRGVWTRSLARRDKCLAAQ